jgi:hypothetical protein
MISVFDFMVVLVFVVNLKLYIQLWVKKISLLGIPGAVAQLS